ncbi:tetratricopeptide repeat protein [Candidatus Uhrbacteria bacterium]|nr:tetratricopeptide repeat protein [Candidatus Uhrbacteria bacterium]
MFIRILSIIPRWSLYVLLLIIPIFFLPFTSEIVELPKQYLMYALVGIGFLAWLLRGFLERKIEIRRTPADLALLMLWVVALISSIFSKDRTVSFFGSYDQLTFGFIPLTFYLLLYFLIIQSVDNKKQIARLVRLLAWGITLGAIYFWLKVIGAVPVHPFLPQWNPAALTQGRFGILLAIPLAAGFLGLMDAGGRRAKIGLGIMAAIAYITMLAIGHTAILIFGAVALAAAVILATGEKSQERPAVISVMLTALLIFVLLAIFKGLRFLTLTVLPAEVSLAQLTSFKIAGGTIMDGIGRALIGSGPGTFAHAFSAFRPESFNLNLLWSLRFSAPFSEASGLLATLGILGLLPFLFLVLTVGSMIFSGRSAPRSNAGSQNTDLVRHSGILWLIVVFALFAVPFTTALWVAFFSALALTMAAFGLTRPSETFKKWNIAYDSTRYAIGASFCTLALLAAFLTLGVYLGRFYAGEIAFARGLSQGARREYDLAIDTVARAAGRNPESVRYYLTLTRLQFQSATEASRQEKPDADKVGARIVGAVQTARRATELAPNSAAAWEQLGTMYAQVIALAPEARQWAVDAFSRAIELEPSNPVLYLWRGQLQSAMQKPEEARRDLERAIELKPNYLEAHIVMAVFLEAEGNRDGAVQILERALPYGSGNMEFLVQLARAYVNRDKDDDRANAERILNALLARNPDYANARFIRGTLYEKQGKSAEAVADFRKVEELNPGNAEVKAKIQTLTGQLAPPISPPQSEE